MGKGPKGEEVTTIERGGLLSDPSNLQSFSTLDLMQKNENFFT